MKKLFPKLILIVLAMVLALVLVACNETNGGTNTGDSGGNEYESAVYTVTFVSNSSLTYNPIQVEYGKTIAEPLKPARAGYDFSCWSTGSTSADRFEFTTPVTSNLTLTAVWTPRIYSHNYDLTAVLTKNTDGTWKITSGMYDTGDNNQNVTLSTTYLSTANLGVPITTKADDYFCYWYYLDENNIPVQFSDWTSTTTSGDRSTSVPLYNSSTFRLTRSLTLYPMWYSQLPTVTVEYVDENGTKFSDQDGLQYNFKYRDAILTAQQLNPAREGYLFDAWYYVVLNSNDEEIKTDFVFDDPGLTTDTPTLLTYAVTDATDIFSAATLTLHVRWIKEVIISNENDFSEYHQKVTADDISEDELALLLAAHITIEQDITLSSTYTTMFSADRPFVGIIDGGIYNANTLIGRHSIIGGTFEGTSLVALFGVMNGTVQNLNVSGTIIKISEGYANKVYVSPLVAQNGGSILNCQSSVGGLVFKQAGYSLSGSIATLGYASMNFGGICASNSGSIVDCTATIAGLEYYGESFVFGGICATNSANGTIANAKVTLSNIKAECYDDNNASNGRTYVYVGGFAGENNGSLSESEFSISGVEITSSGILYMGGAVGTNSGSIAKTHGSMSASAKVGGSIDNNIALGGLIGRNEGTLTTSYVDVSINVNAALRDNVKVAAGGIAGISSNFASGSSTRGSIVSSYATGSVEVSVDSNLSGVEVYAGGVSGLASKTTFSNSFTLVDVTVTNSGTSNIGFVSGQLTNSSTVAATVRFSAENILTLNEVVYDATEENFPISNSGAVTEESNFKDIEWVTGDNLGFAASIWEIKEANVDLPTFKIQE